MSKWKLVLLPFKKTDHINQYFYILCVLNYKFQTDEKISHFIIKDAHTRYLQDNVIDRKVAARTSTSSS